MWRSCSSATGAARADPGRRQGGERRRPGTEALGIPPTWVRGSGLRASHACPLAADVHGAAGPGDVRVGRPATGILAACHTTSPRRRQQGVVRTACCPNPNNDGRDHPVSDGAFFLALILGPVVLLVAWRVILWRFSRLRPPE